MPWKNSLPLEERTRFVLQLKAGADALAQLCREYGVSRKTAYKWWRRYRQGGLAALAEQSRRPHRGPPRMTLLWQGRLRSLRRRYPRWGAGKLHARMRVQFPRSRPPALSTVSFWLRRLGLIVHRPIRARRGPVLEAVRLTAPRRVNEVWTVDFKGWVRTADGVRCEPLTMRDLFSRYVLAVRLLFNQSEAAVRTAMSRVFVRYGLPEIIRVDNGAPFGGKGALGLSRLSVWWLGLGIKVEFIRPACPQDNGAHEQMHRTLAADTMRPPAATPRQQQARWHWWRRYYNHERPHEALGQKVPAQRYRPSPRPFRKALPSLSYPRGCPVHRVCGTGSIKWEGRLRFIGRAFFGEQIALRPVELGTWEVYFGPNLIGTLHSIDPGGMRPASRKPSYPKKV